MQIKQAHFLLSLFILLWISMELSAQPAKTSILPEPASIQIYTLGNRAFALRTTKPDSTIILSNQALKLSRQFNHLRSQVSLLRIKGLAYYSLKQYDAALENNHAALKLARQIDYRVGTILNTLGNVYFFLDDYENATRHYEQSLGYAAAKKDTIGQIDALHNLGSVGTNSGQYKAAYSYYLQSLDLQRAKKFLKIELTTLRHIGWLYFENNELQPGIEAFEEGIALAAERKDWKALATFYQYLGAAYNKKGFYDKSLAAYQQELKVREKLPADLQAATNKFRLVLFEVADEEIAEVLNYSQQGLQIAKDNQDEIGEIKFLRIIGYLYSLQGQCDTAITYVSQAIKQLEKIKLSDWKASALFGMGDCLEQLNQLDSALVYLNRSFLFAKNSKWIEKQSTILATLGKVYFRQSKLSLAQQYLEDAIQLAQKTELPKEEANARLLMYQLLEQQKQYQPALEQLKQYQELRDFLANEERTKKVATLKANYNFAKEKEKLAQINEREKRQLDEQIQRQRNWTILTMLGLGFSLFAFYLNYRFQKIKRENALAQEKLKADLQAQKLQKAKEVDAFKTRLFVNISHELRTPLSIIMGMNEKIQENPTQWLDEGAKLIRKNTHQLLNLTNQILEFHKLESESVQLKMIQGDVVNYLKYILSSFEPLAADKDIQLAYESSAEFIMMDHDQEKLQWIVANLLSNAIKFTPAGGSVELSLQQANHQLLIQVKDTGIGIPEAEQPHIFDRYFQIANAVNPVGSGIGLSLVKELVKLLGGKVKVSSKINVGSVFTVQLPITQRANFVIAAISRSDAPIYNEITNEKQLVIDADKTESLPQLLIVEDNPDMVQFLTACLAADYELHIAKNGQAGIDKGLELIPDLIISDVMMPMKNGYELCATLKADERTSHIPIVLLTAKADINSKLSGLKMGADAFLNKPFNEKELKIRLENLLQLRQQLQEKYAQLSPQIQPTSELTLEDRFLQKITVFVRARMSHKDFDLENLCQHLQMSRSQVFRKVKALTGKPPSALIRTIRLHAAHELLHTSDLTVAEVAYEVGFTSSSYFSNTYLAEFNVRPSQVRK
ncbi:MAG: tetratricopeptide repeat protein [Saprospiraceae bacterium]